MTELVCVYNLPKGDHIQQSQCYEHGKSKRLAPIVSRSLNESNSKSGQVKGEGIATQEPS